MEDKNILKYRVYALVIGQVLKPRKLFDCEVKKIGFKEQKNRLFSPIQSSFSDNNNFMENLKTYATSLPYIDPMQIKSNYVLVYDIEENDVKSALGGAIKYFDKICRFLTFSYGRDFFKYTNRNSIIGPYLYQVNKIYKINNNGEEVDLDFKLESKFIYLPNRPELKEWRNADTQNFLEEAFDFNNDILKRSIKYLYSSAIGRFIKHSSEKIILDHFKSIEIIINSLSSVNGFKNRVDVASKIILLTTEEKEKVKNLWDSRSKFSDTAHPPLDDQSERYPNQFPPPSSTSFLYSSNDPIALIVCFKYFLYIKNQFFIEIENFNINDEEKFGKVNPWLESNHFNLFTTEKDKNKLKSKIRKYISQYLRIKESEVSSINFNNKKNSVIVNIKYKI